LGPFKKYNSNKPKERILRLMPSITFAPDNRREDAERDETSTQFLISEDVYSRVYRRITILRR